jgi:hypothetical protein
LSPWRHFKTAREKFIIVAVTTFQHLVALAHSQQRVAKCSWDW